MAKSDDRQFPHHPAVRMEMDVKARIGKEALAAKRHLKAGDTGNAYDCIQQILMDIQWLRGGS